MNGAAWAAVLHSAGKGAPLHVEDLGAMVVREPVSRFERVSVGAARVRLPRERRVKRMERCIFDVCGGECEVSGSSKWIFCVAKDRSTINKFERVVSSLCTRK